MQTARLALLPSAVLALLTAGYCWLIWLAIGAFHAALPVAVSDDLPLISRLTMAPLLPVPFHALHWQLLAVAVLVGGVVWGVRRSRVSGDERALLLPAVLVVGWILTSVCWHAAGVLAPMVSVAYVLQ